MLVGSCDRFIHVCESVVFLLDDGDLDGFLVELIFQFLNFLVLFLSNIGMLLPQIFNNKLDVLHFLLNGRNYLIFLVVFLCEKIIVLQLILKISKIFKQLLILFLQKLAIILKQSDLLLQHQFHPLPFIITSEAILILIPPILLILTLILTLLFPVQVLPMLVLKLLLDALTFRL